MAQAALHNIKINKGYNYVMTMRKVGTPSLTGWKARLIATYIKYDGDVAFELTTENGGITIQSSAVGDKFVFSMNPTQTAAIKDESIVYDLAIFDAQSNKIKWMYGNVELTNEVGAV